VKKQKKIRATPELIAKLKPFWSRLQRAEEAHSARVCEIEKDMEKETGIKDIEFFRSPDDGCYCGIGNVDRTMSLIHDRQLE
jgi:hypothetical protein